jgi:hypothetical protein
MAQGERQALRSAADVAETARFDLEHHRVDHQPDQHGHDQVDPGDLEVGHRFEGSGHGEARADTGSDRSDHPDRQEAFEHTDHAACGRAARRNAVD